MAEAAALERVKQQRFAGILCRYPIYRLCEDEEKQVVQRYERKVKPSL